jgi:pimeloyl-ACP methyl ester carboxylesterase
LNVEPAGRSPLRHRIVQAEGLAIHVVEGGDAAKPPVVFLHGWPQSWLAFESVMSGLEGRAHVVALDLPGVGDSRGAPPSGDKRTLAKIVHGVIRLLGLRNVTLVGHDAGGMIVYAYLRAYGDELARAAILNTVVPGVDPWDEVRRDPRIWHFGFHAVPDLPEELVTGRESRYFDFFFDAIAARPGAVPESRRREYCEAYLRPEALRAGFDWYRALEADEKDNLAVKGRPVDTPVLYLRGDAERGDLEIYVKGLRDAGLVNVKGRAIPGSGHFTLDERPEEVWAALEGFLQP